MERFKLALAAALVFAMIAVFAQEKNLVQIKAFDEQMNPLTNLGVSINGKDFITIEHKKTAYYEVSKDDLPPKFIKLNKPELEAESWSYNRGTLEIIVRKKMYALVDVRVETADRRPVTNAAVSFKGRRTINTTTNVKGNVELPLALDERITGANQFSIADYRITHMLDAGTGKVLLVEALVKKPKLAVVTPSAAPSTKSASTASNIPSTIPLQPALEQQPVFIKEFDITRLDSIRSLTVFYAVFKNYDISALDAETKKKIDYKFYQLVGQLQQTNDKKRFIGKISDSSFVKNDVENLLAQAQYENTLLDNFRNDFDEKVKIISGKLSGGASKLGGQERQKMINDLVMLERVLEQNESKFYKNISEYRTVLASLKSSFSDIQMLEDKLSESEAKRLEEQNAFRTKILLAVTAALIFGALVILLVLLRARVEKQKRSLVRANQEVKRINENLEGLVYERSRMLVEAYQEMDIFLYRASHDLRAPICTIIGLCNLALQHSRGNGDLMRKIYDTSVKMDGMLKKLRMMGEVNNPSNYSLTYLNEIIQNVLANFQKFIDDNGIEVEVDCKSDMNFYSYSEVIEIILYNLVENALFFSTMRPNHTSKISILATIKSDELFLSVYDNGIGIEDHIRLRLWDMFFVGNEFSKGNGLGLYIVLKSVQSLNGNIDVQTEPNRYTRFSITVPVNTTVTSTLANLGSPKEVVRADRSLMEV